MIKLGFHFGGTARFISTSPRLLAASTSNATSKIKDFKAKVTEGPDLKTFMQNGSVSRMMTANKQ